MTWTHVGCPIPVLYTLHNSWLLAELHFNSLRLHIWIVKNWYFHFYVRVFCLLTIVAFTQEHHVASLSPPTHTTISNFKLKLVTWQLRGGTRRSSPLILATNGELCSFRRASSLYILVQFLQSRSDQYNCVYKSLLCLHFTCLHCFHINNSFLVFPSKLRKSSDIHICIKA